MWRLVSPCRSTARLTRGGVQFTSEGIWIQCMTKPVRSSCGAAAGCGILWTSTTAAVWSAMRSTEVNNHETAWRLWLTLQQNFLSHLIHSMVVHLLLVYKSSATVPSNIHHQFHSPRVLHSLYPATIQRALIHSLLFVEMFSKSFVAPILLLALTSSVNAQACVYPALGVSGTPDTNNVQKPSDDAPCGTVNIAQNLDSSTPLAPEGGYYYPNVINFQA
jgi:hypothetical protein